MSKKILKTLIKISIYFALINVTIGLLYGGRGNKNSYNKNYIDNNSLKNHDKNNDNTLKNNNKYCDKEICPKGQHIACHNNGALSPRCPSDAKIVNLEKDQQDLIVHLHNKHRSTVASGKLPGYKPATRMATMIWDDELAKLAELNVKKCNFEHDECYNTKRFRNAGQCLDTEHFYEPDGLDINKLMTQSVDAWFNEYKNIDMSYVENFKMDHKFFIYGNFLELVIDRNTHVGCAAINLTDPIERYEYPDYRKVNIACNYASVCSQELPVYESGISASKCTTGENPNYPGLCSLKERINPNYKHDFDF